MAKPLVPSLSSVAILKYPEATNKSPQAFRLALIKKNRRELTTVKKAHRFGWPKTKYCRICGIRND